LSWMEVLLVFVFSGLIDGYNFLLKFDAAGVLLERIVIEEAGLYMVSVDVDIFIAITFRERLFILLLMRACGICG
jgi:hypothetical protein